MPTGIYIRKPRTDEHKKNLSIALTGKKVSQETRNKLSAVQKGTKKPWIRISNQNRIVTEETRIKIGLSHRGLKRPDTSLRLKTQQFGKKNPMWKHGLTKELNLRGIYSKRRKEKLAGRERPDMCEVCGGGGRICFDHDHETGKFRGWLCTNCNVVLGHAKDNKELLKKLIIYLENDGIRP